MTVVLHPHIAIVGGGDFANNVKTAFTAGGYPVAFVIDEFVGPIHFDLPAYPAVKVLNAEDQARQVGKKILKYVIAISIKKYRDAAIARLLEQGIPASRILPLETDEDIPIISLIIKKFSASFEEALLLESCQSLFQLEEILMGEQWRQALDQIQPEKPVIAFAFYGRGGGFRKHIAGLIPRLKAKYNVITCMDESLPGNDDFDVPSMFIGPRSLAQQTWMDIVFTAHFLPCCHADRPKVNFLHTSFDFALSREWLIERFDSGNPHYIIASTQVTFDWLVSMLEEGDYNHRVAVIPGGYMRFDDNVRAAQACQEAPDALIYAPTLSLNAIGDYTETYSIPHAFDMISRLLEHFSDRTIIFRPHPNDLEAVKNGRCDAMAKPFRDIMQLAETHPRLVVDDTKLSYMHSYNRAAVMISDTSSTAYTYALSTLRPVVFFWPEKDKIIQKFGDQSFFVSNRHEVGQVASDVDGVISSIQALIADRDIWADKINTYRNRICFHPGQSADYIEMNIDSMLAADPQSDWALFNW